MPTTIDEDVITAEKAAPIEVPVGADTRTAESLTAAWTAIAARFKWIEAFAEWLGVTDTTVSDETITRVTGLSDPVIFQGGIKFTGAAALTDAVGIELGNADGGYLYGPIFTQNSNGRAPKKFLNGGAVGADQTVDPREVNDVKYSPSASIAVQIESHTYAAGDYVRVKDFNTTALRTITLKDPAGATLVVFGPGSATKAAYAEAVFDGSAWYVSDVSTP